MKSKTFEKLTDKEYIRKRGKVLDNTLLLEDMINEMLAGLLEITNSENSLSLGSQNSALSLSNKVNLLIDLGAIGKESQAKFSHFMSIRNKFLHLRRIKSFTECYNCIGDALINFLKKKYPVDGANGIEEIYEKQYSLLSNDVIERAADVQKAINERMTEWLEARANYSTLITLPNAVLNELKNLELELGGQKRLDQINHTINRIKSIVQEIRPLLG